MEQVSKGYRRKHQEGMLGAVSVGFFLILIGVLFVATPKLFDNIYTFLSHFQSAQVGTTGIYIPAPEGIATNLDVYSAAQRFSFVWGVFLVAMLGVRFILGSSVRRKTENVGDITFWLGASYAIQTFLVQPSQVSPIDTSQWFEFWTIVLMLIGISLIARAIFLIAARAVGFSRTKD